MNKVSWVIVRKHIDRDDVHFLKGNSGWILNVAKSRFYNHRTNAERRAKVWNNYNEAMWRYEVGEVEFTYHGTMSEILERELL